MRRATETWRALPAWLQKLALLLLAVQLCLIAAHLIAYLATQSAADPKQARSLLDFNQENSLQTLWSAAVMAAAGLAAIDAGQPAGQRDRRSYAWLLVGLGFLWLGAEELVSLHENVQISSGVDWPILYLPALGIGAWAMIRSASEMDPPFRRLLLSGLCLLALAVTAELLSSPSIQIDFMVRNLIEENLELGGAVMVLIAALAHGRPALRSDSPLVDPPRDSALS